MASILLLTEKINMFYLLSVLLNVITWVRTEWQVLCELRQVDERDKVAKEGAGEDGGPDDEPRVGPVVQVKQRGGTCNAQVID